MVSRGPRNTKITWCHLWTLKSEIFGRLSLELTEIWNLNVYEMELIVFFYLPVRQGLSWVPDQNKYIWSCCWVPPGNISQPEPESKEERQERKKSLKDFSDDLLSVMIVEEWSGRWQRGLNSHLKLQNSMNGHNALIVILNSNDTVKGSQHPQNRMNS